MNVVNDITAEANKAEEAKEQVKRGDRQTRFLAQSVILEEAGTRGADLLVKGAYTHSRLRQMFFGGATSHILAEAEIPVLMAN